MKSSCNKSNQLATNLLKAIVLYCQIFFRGEIHQAIKQALAEIGRNKMTSSFPSFLFYIAKRRTGDD